MAVEALFIILSVAYLARAEVVFQYLGQRRKDNRAFALSFGDGRRRA